MPDRPANAVRGFVFDMDGTLAISGADGGDYALLPGVSDVITHLRARHLPFIVLTNGTARPPARYAESLAAAGLDIRPTELMTPSSVAAEFFAASGIRRVLVLGGEGVSGPLAEAGIDVLRPGGHAGKPEAVYIGWHPEFGFADIAAAIDVVLAGAPAYVSSDVPFFYTQKGRTLGISGLIAAAVAKATGQAPALTGKPSAIAANIVARRLGCAREEMVIVGDDPLLEIEMALRCGAIGIGVTSGLTGRRAWDEQPAGRRPHYVVDRIDEIVARDLLQLEGP